MEIAFKPNRVIKTIIIFFNFGVVLLRIISSTGCSVPKYSTLAADSILISFILLCLKFHFDSLHICTVCLLKLWPPRQWKTIIWQSKPKPKPIQIQPIRFIYRHCSRKHHNQQVEISLFCTRHLTGLIVESIVSVLPSDWPCHLGGPAFS